MPATLTLAPGGSLAFADVVTDLFHAAPAQGAIVLSSSVPVAAALRLSVQDAPDQGQYASVIAALDASQSVPAAGALAIGAPNNPTRRTTLFLFNRGSSGTATLNGYDASGAPVGQLAVPVGALVATRVDQLFPALGAPGTSLGSVRVTPSAGMQLYAQTVEVDGVTGDTEPSDLR